METHGDIRRSLCDQGQEPMSHRRGREFVGWPSFGEAGCRRHKKLRVDLQTGTTSFSDSMSVRSFLCCAPSLKQAGPPARGITHVLANVATARPAPTRQRQYASWKTESSMGSHSRRDTHWKVQPRSPALGVLESPERGISRLPAHFASYQAGAGDWLTSKYTGRRWECESWNDSPTSRYVAQSFHV